MNLQKLICQTATALIFLGAQSQGEYLFSTDITESGRQEFIMADLNFAEGNSQYSEWDNFYAFYGVQNYPDIFAPFGGVKVSDLWYPTSLLPAQIQYPGLFPDPAYPFNWQNYTNSSNPNAFWSPYNPTVTQVGTRDARITAGDNIYSFQAPLSYVLKDNPSDGPQGFLANTVVFQFQTDGMLADFNSIRLIAVFADGEREFFAHDSQRAEFLREYKIPGTYEGEGSWSAGAGYRNRVAVQWDLSNLVNDYGDTILSYRIEWDTTHPHVSLQQVALDTTEASIEGGYGLAASRIWDGGDGNWLDSNRWRQRSQYGDPYGSGPVENGNIRFQNLEEANISYQTNHILGELLFESAQNVTLTGSPGSILTANTGITTTSTATGTYTIDADYALGALNFFEINSGSVILNRTVSGQYGIVKTGEGRLILAGNNTFSRFLGIQDGTVRIEGTNSYTGETTLVNGRIELASDALHGSGALGTSTNAIVVGADASLYQNVSKDWLAELILDGDRTLGREISFSSGDNAKRLGAINTSEEGALITGHLRFTTNSVNPDSTDNAAGAVYLTARNTTDYLIIQGAMTGGDRSKIITLDGEGTTVYRGPVKTYNNSTQISSGTLLLEETSGYNGVGNIDVRQGARLVVNGVLSGSGSLTLSNGARLEGTGNISRALRIGNGAILAIGNSIGTLNTDIVDFASGGTLEWEIGNATGVAGTDWDFLNIGSSLTISASVTQQFTLAISIIGTPELGLPNFNILDDYRWHIANLSNEGAISQGTWNGDINDLFNITTTGFPSIPPGGTFYIETTGSDLYLNYQYQSIPEPSTLALLIVLAAIGGGKLYLSRRRLQATS